MRRSILALALLIPAAGCGTFGFGGGPRSFVAASISPADAPALASAVVAFVTMRQPPGPIAVVAPDGDPAGLAQRITADLRAAGHVVSPSGRNHLAYQLAPYDGGVLVRVTLDDERAARVLDRRGGRLVPGGPYTMTIAEAR